ncbi:MAG TPA: GAF domain-containing sensor histidine kinase [Egicoccus sp.]|nr:GAF domain-containing sensor histidine kinase [Egicoccus sp.]HSK24280.1 GAF domain-containing sensor histidine kinase [Egicoccus sp.]
MTTTDDAPGPPRPSVGDALAAAGAGGDLESVTRPLLQALQDLTGLSSTYLTSIDWERNQQRIQFSLNTGSITIPEQLEVEWTDTLCHRALESGQVCTDEVPEIWGDSRAAAELGIQTYVSSPIRLPDGQIYGTLCGASAERVAVDQRTADLLQVFSRIISDVIVRERARQASEARALEAEERLRSRAQFLAMAEHQLKTPMTVIVGWASALQSGRLDEQETATAVDLIVQQAKRVSGEITELLDEATSQVVASDLSLQTIELRPFLDDLAVGLRRLSAAHPIEVDAPEGLAAVADARALRIVIEHLVENAVKYAPEGGQVTLCAGSAPANRVALSVRDEGPGLPDDVDVFAPFARGDTVVPGSGLGLHIVRTLVHAMQGDVTARRREPVGSDFRIVLPA